MSPGEGTPPSGLLLVDKPAGITSHDAVDRVRRALSTRKVGHAGTLDPMATGLLLVGVGRTTRLLRFLADLPKSYLATGLLGIETETLDAEGRATRERDVNVSERELRAALAEFTGDILQVPPAYSAVKVGGRRSYDAARRGEPVASPPRPVRVFAFDLLLFHAPSFDVAVECSSGTYVRTLVADVGARLGCGAHVTALRRTAIGPFEVDRARPPEDPGQLLPVERAAEHLPGVALQTEEARAARSGAILGPAGFGGPYRVLGPDGSLIGIYRDDGAKAVPEVILASAPGGS
ncbi:MAG: tRNA pseudouridine(55) synthase TruB [Actinobacteria bacterium]|nr:tRNA pseudouridine(55) synthase TruB [Actinomycetota bacterium]